MDFYHHFDIALPTELKCSILLCLRFVIVLIVSDTVQGGVNFITEIF